MELSELARKEIMLKNKCLLCKINGFCFFYNLTTDLLICQDFPWPQILLLIYHFLSITSILAVSIFVIIK